MQDSGRLARIGADRNIQPVLLGAGTGRLLGAGSHGVDACHLGLTRTVRANGLLATAPEGIAAVNLTGQQVVQLLTQLGRGDFRSGDVEGSAVRKREGFDSARSSLWKRSSRLSTTTAWPRFSIRAVKGT